MNKTMVFILYRENLEHKNEFYKGIYLKPKIKSSRIIFFCIESKTKMSHSW